MFVRRLKTRSGSTSVQIIEKIGRNNHVVKSVGTSSDEGELHRLVEEARIFIDRQKGEPLFFLH